MGKKIIVIAIVILALIPIGGLYFLNFGNPIDRFIANRYVPEYLKKKGYSDGELAEAHYVEPKHLINKDFHHGHYMVRFSDEADITYYYGISKKGKEVKQFCERDDSAAENPIDYYDKNNESKHLERDCVNSLDNRD